MPSTKLSRMLAILRRYTRAQEKDRVPAEMIEDFKAAVDERPQRERRPSADGDDRPTLH